MAEILQDPAKLVMLIALLAIEIAAATALVVMWCKACKERKKEEEENG